VASVETLTLMMRRLWRAYVRAGALRERALRGVMPGRMRFVHYSWPLRADLCPCDVHFCEFLEERNIRQRSIFHFGTGGHHLVGLRNHDAGLQNDVLGLTVAPKEHLRYVRKVIHDPLLGRHYKVLFADIFSLSAATLPVFDLVTLFHLCEFTDASTAGHRLTDAEVLHLFWSKTAPGGLLLFYPRSYGYKKLTPLIEQAVNDGKLAFVESYKSLVVYRASARAAASS
jgi:hypothetical protein